MGIIALLASACIIQPGQPGTGAMTLIQFPGAGTENRHAALANHSPIYINGNSQFNGTNGVSSGNGTAPNPYIIEGWDINASTAHGIRFENTSAYFTLKNCCIYGGSYNGASNYGVYLFNATDGKLENNGLAGNYEGIRLEGSPRNVISCNNISGNYIGIELHSSSRNIFSHNIVEASGWHGISLSCAGYNVVEYNEINSNIQAGIAFSCASSTDVTHNNVSHNGEGMYISGATNTIKFNSVFLNDNDGIRLKDYYGTEISYNIFTGNTKFGINISSTTNYTRIHHNNFDGNNGAGPVFDKDHVQANDSSSGMNFWNLSGAGNYWSDWTSPDVKSGPKQDQPGSDGIVDIPYPINITGNCSDMYPLTTSAVAEFAVIPVSVGLVFIALAAWGLKRKPGRRARRQRGPGQGLNTGLREILENNPISLNMQAYLARVSPHECQFHASARY